MCIHEFLLLRVVLVPFYYNKRGWKEKKIETNAVKQEERGKVKEKYVYKCNYEEVSVGEESNVTLYTPYEVKSQNNSSLSYPSHIA